MCRVQVSVRRHGLERQCVFTLLQIRTEEHLPRGAPHNKITSAAFQAAVQNLVRRRVSGFSLSFPSDDHCCDVLICTCSVSQAFQLFCSATLSAIDLTVLLASQCASSSHQLQHGLFWCKVIFSCGMFTSSATFFRVHHDLHPRAVDPHQSLQSQVVLGCKLGWKPHFRFHFLQEVHVVWTNNDWTCTQDAGLINKTWEEDCP